MVIFGFEFLQEILMFWEAISNTLKLVKKDSFEGTSLFQLTLYVYIYVEAEIRPDFKNMLRMHPTWD